MRNQPLYLLLAAVLVATTFAVDCRAADSLAPGAAAVPIPEPWEEVYELALDDGTLLVKGIDIAGQLVDAAVDTGCGGIILPASVASRISFEALEELPALDYSGAAADYPSGFIRTRRLGAQRPTYESALAVPDDQLGAHAIIPLSHFQADLICFICSEGRLVLCDNAPEWGDEASAEAAAGSAIHYLPYWENLGGIFLAVQLGDQRCLALIDTGASVSSVNAAFIGANPGLFRATGSSASYIGIHGGGTTEELVELLGPARLLSIDGTGDVPLHGDVSALPAFTSNGETAALGDYGADLLPYFNLASPNPWPVVMIIGMDMLAGYDFAFDTRSKLLMLMEQTPRPNAGAAAEAATSG